MTTYHLMDHPPSFYEETASLARQTRDFELAARLEKAGDAVSIGHKRGERHMERARRDMRMAGDPGELPMATEADVKWAVGAYNAQEAKRSLDRLKLAVREMRAADFEVPDYLARAAEEAPDE